MESPVTKRFGLVKTIVGLVIFSVIVSVYQPYFVLAHNGADDPSPIRNWTYENVEGSYDMGRYPSLAMDTAGNPHIGYYDYTNSDIRYIHWTGNAWIRETVRTYVYSRFTSLALDGTTPHMLFGKQQLIYSYRSDAGWQTEIIGTGSEAGFYSGSLALDAAGDPHISYYDYEAGAFKYARRTPTGWVQEIINERPYAISSTSITIDPSGNPHIAISAGDQVINYAFHTGTGWNLENVETESPQGVSIRLDNNGQPLISYYEYWQDEVKLARKMSGVWQIESVDAAATTSNSQTSLAISTNNIPYISYYDDNFKKIKVADRESGSWNVELVEDAEGAGEIPSLAIDQSDNLHIAYYDETINAVKYGHRSSVGWAIQVVHPAMDAGDSFTMVLDGSDRIHLVYTAGWNGDKTLRYDRKTAQGWEYEEVHHTSTIGHARLVLDSSEAPHISLFDDQTDEFLYAWRSDNGWISETIDTNGDLLGASSLALNSQDEPQLAYFAQASTHVFVPRYARWTTNGWITETLTSTIYAQIPSGISLGMDIANRPHVAYGLNGLWYGWKDGSDWIIELVDDNYSSSGGKVSLVLDSSDHAHISYQRYTPGVFNLVYAHNKSGFWSYEIVDDSQDTGWNSSLVLDNDGFPHISYYDRGNLTFKYANLSTDGWLIESIVSIPFSLTKPDTNLKLDSGGKPWIATSTLKVMRYLKGGELYIPRLVYLPAIYR